MTSFNIYADSGGPLSPEQASYDVIFYDLDLTIDPTTKSINGSLLCRAEILNPINTLVLDLDDPFTVDSIIFKINEGNYSNVTFSHVAGKVNIDIPGSVAAGDMVSLQIFYNGTPRIASNPPWGEGFVWSTTSTGKPWIGVVCEENGADIWWPCKDHPSDEPDSMSMSFTVPNPLICVSNGRYLGSTDNGNDTTTYNWHISQPINNYNVSIYAAEFLKIEDSYQSVSGDTIPFYFWVLQEDYNTAVNYMDVFLREFNFLESICGPFPFANDKHGWAHAPYWGMEHQTIIAYGHNFTVNKWGFDYIHYHELAHEWWGNFITGKDWADLWIHEGLASYTEALYVEHLSGMDSYHQYMDNIRPADNHTHPLAPRESLTAGQAFENLDSYNRGSAVMHTLRYHLGDEIFFDLFKRWAYPNLEDVDNTNGRLNRIMTTEDMKIEAEEITGKELDQFFDVFFREKAYPVLHVVRKNDSTTFSWNTEKNILLDVSIPILVNGTDRTIQMIEGQGSSPISINDSLVIDPKKWILMGEPSIITSLKDDIAENIDYHLEQNYPNPFKNTTTIKFSIPEPQFVSLKVFNILGTEIITLVKDELAKGKYEVSFDGSNLSSGTYFYCLQAGNYTESRKLVLLN
jgi:aminopeptidase N